MICRDLAVLGSSVRSFSAGELLCRRKNNPSGKRPCCHPVMMYFLRDLCFVKPTVTARVGTLRPPGVTVYSIPRYFSGDSIIFIQWNPSNQDSLCCPNIRIDSSVQSVFSNFTRSHQGGKPTCFYYKCRKKIQTCIRNETDKKNNWP